MPHETEHGERASGVAESRLHARLPVHSLAYVELTEENAGLILNISETGMAVQAVQMLTASEFPRMRFRLPGTEIPVEAAGKLVWQIRSKKEAGIEFVDLTEKARSQIRNWIADEPKRAAAAIARTQRKESAIPELPQRTETTEQASSSRRQTQPQASSTAAPTGDGPGEARPKAEPVSPSLLRLALEAEYRKALRGKNADAAPAAASSAAATSTPGIERRLFQTREAQDSAAAEQVGGGGPRFQPHANGATTSERAPLTSKPPVGSGNGAHETPEDGHSREWPPLHLQRPSILQPEAAGEANLHFPRWNANAADAGLDFQRPRRSRTYLVLIGLVIALGLWAFALLNPGVVTRERFEELAQRIEAAGKQPPQNETAQNSTPASATRGDSNDGPQAPNQNPPGNDGQAPRGGDQPAISNSEDSKAGDQRQLPLTPHPSATANQLKSANSNRSGETVRTAGTTESNRTESPAKAKPAVQTGRQNEERQTEPASARRATESQAVSSAAGNYAATQSPIYQSATPQRSAESERPSTETVPPPSNAPTYSSASEAPATQQETQSAPPVQPDQDAYARRSTNANNSAATASRSTPGSETRSVELPNGQISPVTPSVPLSGVPSGSVGATSRFHAIRGTQLTGSLQIGGLASSYSPTYPIEAARQHVEGTVRLDVVVSKDGMVKSVQVLSGPPMLASASAAAVKDWRYGETFLAGQPVETQHYVTLVFRLAK